MIKKMKKIMNEQYELIFSKLFEKRFRKLGPQLQKEGEKKIEKLKTNPKEIGKPIRYVLSNLYELHLSMYRIFYVIDDNVVKVLLLDVEHKDECDKYLRSLTKEKIKQIIGENF